MFKKMSWVVLTLLIVLSFVLAACQPAATQAPEPTQAAEQPTEAAMPEVDFAVMPGGFLERAIQGEFDGTTVSVDGPFTDPDDRLFNNSMVAFEDATGIDVQYIGDKEFESRLPSP